MRREGHRLEHAPLHPVEREDRDVHGDDDRDAEQDRATDLDGRRSNIEARSSGAPPPDEALDHTPTHRR
jgi:hypothetical protein